MRVELTWAKTSAVATAIFSEYIIQHVLYRIFFFMFNLCYMSSQEEAFKYKMSVKEKIVPKWQHFKILMP